MCVCVCVCVCVLCFFVHSFFDRHVGYFHNLNIINIMVINMHVQLSLVFTYIGSCGSLHLCGIDTFHDSSLFRGFDEFIRLISIVSELIAIP